MINESRAAVVMSRQPSSAVIRTHQDFQSLSALGNYFKVFENQFQKVSFYENIQTMPQVCNNNGLMDDMISYFLPK